MKTQQIVQKKPQLIWYTDQHDQLSDAAVVEAVLNNGDFEDVKKLIKTLGVKKVGSIFRKQIRGPRCNYDPKIKHYFSLYFRTYAR